MAPIRAARNLAGGGAGGGSVVLALMLLKHNVSGIVVHLDLSSHSIRLARERAISHNVSNVRYVQGSLLNTRDRTIGHDSVMINVSRIGLQVVEQVVVQLSVHLCS